APRPSPKDALAAPPDAIRPSPRFPRRHCEAVDPDAPFTTQVAEHITQGQWLGNGSPYLVFGPDLEPLTDEEIATFLGRFRGLREEMASWAATLTDEQLDALPEGGGRTTRAVLLH